MVMNVWVKDPRKNFLAKIILKHLVTVMEARTTFRFIHIYKLHN